MSNFIVKKVAVLGAGVMGAQIAAHLVNSRVDVILYDLPAREGPKNGIVERAIQNLRKLSPAPLGHPDLADAIRVANYDDDLPALAECDLVIEAIAERADWKHDLYRKVAPHVGKHAIFATNTSGLSIARLAEGFGDDADLLRRFCGVHFFNPPRYMHLVELIPTGDTDPGILDRLETFLTSTLGKGCVRAKDTPNFIANRVGIFSMLSTIREASNYGLSYDVVDDLTGEKLGRAKSGTFRTADVVGLDTMAHVIRTMQENLRDDPFRDVYATPPALAGLLEKGALGQKTGAGFYRKQGKDILRLDPARGDYVPSGAKADETVARILKKKTWAERLQLLRESGNPQAQFLWALLRNSFHYAAVHLQAIADNARDLDLALRWGFGQKQGPFEIWQQAGWAQVTEWLQADIDAGKALAPVPLPDWVRSGPVAERGGVHQPGGSWSPARGEFVGRSHLPVYRRQVFRAPLAGEQRPGGHSAGTTVHEDDSVRLWTLAGAASQAGAGAGGAPLDDVLILSIKTKMHAIGPGVTAGLSRAVDLAERDYRGLVIWSPDEPFSVGADLQAMLPLFMSGGAKAIEPEVVKLQDAVLRLRYAQVPTVAAVSGMALGGGCELALYCARRVALLESYIGLVEVGIGLIPAAGGLTYGARRASEEQSAGQDSLLLDFVKKYVMAAGTAQVSRSAIDAQAIGYLLPSDPIVFNPHELLYCAIREAQAMGEVGWRPPRRATFRVAGRSAIATITGQLVNMRDGGFISAHDFHLGRTIAEVMCGGDVDGGSVVDERWVMGLERRAFLSLLTHPKTVERVMGMMQTGKPVRN
ncbi:MAG TPA: 3-hydroxyacyl-CoA dehydrogenase/enoyl-CoA hydratase family protein [Burkholderiaceae bacterium]|nr:3-hydroxyacyl-CoA dehydrogenase/enoyl-CoA hydratase family protein [Burkholderiaceae bacterium]